MWNLKTFKEKKTKKNAELRKLKSELKCEQEKRKGDSFGIENLLNLVLENVKIKKQHFHGGSMNGVCCRRLLDNIDQIFEITNKITTDKLKEQTKKDEDIEYITLVCTKFHDIFEVVDLVFFAFVL